MPTLGVNRGQVTEEDRGSELEPQDNQEFSSSQDPREIVVIRDGIEYYRG